jgi:formylglycine-generating enzyme required for sulfatase activity
MLPLRTKADTNMQRDLFIPKLFLIYGTDIIDRHPNFFWFLTNKAPINSIAGKQAIPRKSALESANVISVLPLNSKNMVVHEEYKGIKFNLIRCVAETEKWDEDEDEYTDEDEYDFLLGETHVTQELYFAVMGQYTNNSGYSVDPNLRFPHENSQQRPASFNPITAINFCNRLSAAHGLPPYYSLEEWRRDFGRGSEKITYKLRVIDRHGEGYRLPSVDEWIFAAKAGTGNQWSGTDDEADVGVVAWFRDNSDRMIHQVACLRPNEWGFYDMSGNIEDICFNWIGYDEAIRKPITTPKYSAITPPHPDDIYDFSNTFEQRGGDYRSSPGKVKILAPSPADYMINMDPCGLRIARSTPKELQRWYVDAKFSW